MKSKNIKKKTHNLRKVLPIYAQQKKYLVAVVIFIFITGILGVLSPIFSANTLASLADSKFDTALKFAIIFSSISAVRVIFNGLTELLYVRINARVQYSLTDKLICSINQTKMSKLDSVKIGSITERLGMDINTIGSSYIQMIDMIFEIITNVAFLIYIAFLNIYMFFILLFYVIVLYLICAYRAKVWIKSRKETKEIRDKARSAYYEQVAGVRDVKLLNIKENITNFSNKQNEVAMKFDVKSCDKRNLIRRVQGLVSIIFGALFVILGIVFVNKDFILLTGFLIIYSYYGRVEGLVQYISSLKENNAEGEIAATRVFEVIENYEKEEFGKETIENFSGEIELNNVDFSYNQTKQVLHNLSMTFNPSQMTAIVGKSGSGKTTILNIISKLYESNGGEILFDGKNINLLTEQSIRSNVGVVSQNPYLFNTTIRQNLLFVKPEATDKELVDALKDAQIYDDICALEKGIDSEIGENGVKLSGGQKQRIAIARLLLKDSKVIVFDEATSALDNQSQNKIVETLQGLKTNRTIIIVAHRLSTIVNADKIYVIDGGKNIAEGTHKQLMKTCDEYANLYKLEEKNSVEN